MLTAILNVIDRLINLLEHKRLRGRRLYDDHVSPLFTALKEIHNDNMAMFDDALQTIRSPNRNLPALVSRLQKARLDKLAERVDLVALANAISKTHMTKKKSPVLASIVLDDNLVDFALAVERYFQVAIHGETTNPTFVSASTSLLQILKLLDVLARNHDTQSPLLAEGILNIMQLSRLLESRFSVITESHATLRIHLLT